VHYACLTRRLYFAVRLEKNFSLPVVLWTQRSDNWWNLRGIAGNVSAWVPRSAADLSYVEAAPSAISRGAVDYDRVSGVVYWSQSPADTSSSWSIGAQPVVDALSRKSTSVMQFLSSWHVGGLAVDWFTGNVYVTETEQQLIAVARYDIHDTDMYRIIISSGLEKPSAIAIDPYLGLVLCLPSTSASSIVLLLARLKGYIDSFQHKGAMFIFEILIPGDSLGIFPYLDKM